MASSDAVKKFNALTRPKLMPSGMVPNEWHFDIRYMHLEPTPTHILTIVQPGSRFCHLEYLPVGSTPGDEQSHAFFPETVAQAAPEIVKALIKGFVGGMNLNMGGLPASQIKPMAPWTLTTEDRELALAVERELRRVGCTVIQKIGVSTSSTCEIAVDSFSRIFAGLVRAMGFPDAVSRVMLVPQSISFDYQVRATPHDLQDTTSPDTAILAYVQMLDNCRPYTKEKLNQGPGQYTAILQNARTIAQKPFAELEREAADGDPSALLNCGARLYYGVGCGMDRQAARSYIIQAAFHPRSTDTVKATAHAILVVWYTSASESLRVRYLYAGMHHANKAIQYSRSVAVPGYSIPTVLFRTRHVFRPATKMFKELNFFYSHVWDADEEAEARVKRDTEASVKRMKNPLRYKCAMYGCGIEADHGKMLQKCGGKCDEDKKPYYCSKECQKEDWKTNHKMFCKPGMPCSVIESDSPGIGMLGGASKDGALRMTVPTPGGGQTVVSSSTMSPQFMKDVKEAIENISVGYN